MSKLLVPLLKIFLRKISGNSIEFYTDDLSEILELQNLSENLSQNLSQPDFQLVNRIEPQPDYQRPTFTFYRIPVLFKDGANEIISAAVEGCRRRRANPGFWCDGLTGPPCTMKRGDRVWLRLEFDTDRVPMNVTQE